MADSAGSDLTRHTAEVPLIDQHVHGCWLTEGNRRRFENALNEANTEPLADFDSGFDSQLGFACATTALPSLDCLGTLIRRLIGIAAVNSVKLNWLADFCRPPG